MKGKLISTLVIAATLVPGVAHGQFIEAIAGYAINSMIAKDQRKESSTGEIRFNVFLRKVDGSVIQLPGWNPATHATASWWGDVVLQPVVIVHTSKSPRMVEIGISNSAGALTKIAFVPVSGGRPGKNGTAVDNGGYRHDLPLISVKEIPIGWNAIHASWGGGVAQPVIFERIDYTGMLAMIGQDEEARQALAGSGHSTYPQVPIFSAVIDGQVKTFLTAEQAQAFVQEKNLEPPRREVTGKDSGNRVPTKTSTDLNGLSIVVSDYDPEFISRVKKLPKEEGFKLFKSAIQDNGVELSEDSVEMHNGVGLAILVTLPKHFTISLEKSGESHKFEVKKTEEGYQALVTLKPSSDMSGKLLITSNGKTRHLRFTKAREN